MHEITYNRFAKPLDKANYISPQHKEIYQIDAWRFSAYKMHRIANELEQYAKDKDGKLLDFDQFKKQTRRVYNAYNSQYLRAEIVQAQNAAASADRWHSFSDNEQLFLLQYRTARDERVRASHRILDGITLPKSHPFWQTHYPPNGWGCRCRVVQVVRSRYENDYKQSLKRYKNVINDKDAVPDEFRFNPGKDLKLFPPEASYYNIQEKDAKIVEEAMKIAAPKNLEYKAKGKVFVKLFARQIPEFETNLHYAKILADNFDYEITVLNIINLPNLKNPDFLINEINSELKVIKSTKGILYGIDQAKKQTAKIIVFALDKLEKFDKNVIKEIAKYLHTKINKRYGKSFYKVIFIKDRKTIEFTRQEILNHNVFDRLKELL